MNEYTSAGCSKDEMTDEPASKAAKIRADQGFHEVEVSCTGVGGLHDSFIICDKNPRHLKFIPVKDFKIEHLPSGYQDNDIVDMVRATSDITCRLSVPGVSSGRPDTWPGTDVPFPFSAHKGQKCTMTGTGWVCEVLRNSEKANAKCECKECRRPGTDTPKKTWGKICIVTACHVVYNDEEARHTKSHFFYDSPETDVHKTLTFTGLRVVTSNTKEDWCMMEYATHDMEIVETFVKMFSRWKDIRRKVNDKYVSKEDADMCVSGVGSETNVRDNLILCIVVSHPHGRNKQISLGNWTHRQLVAKDDVSERITYNYNTPTCPGSSGAMVIALTDNRSPDLFHHHPAHSQGRPGNDNSSGVGQESIVSPLTLSENLYM